MFFLRGEATEEEAAPPAGGRFVALSLDGAAPASQLLTRWAIANALRTTDTVVIVNKNAANDPRHARRQRSSLLPAPSMLIRASLAA